MKPFTIIALLAIPTLAVAVPPPQFDRYTEPPDLPGKIKSGEPMEPDKTVPSSERSEEMQTILDGPEAPMPVQSGENMEPDITIIRKGEKTIQEYRINGQIYMIKIIPDIGPAYYMIDTDRDGNLDVRGTDLDRIYNINQWKLLEWK